MGSEEEGARRWPQSDAPAPFGMDAPREARGPIHREHPVLSRPTQSWRGRGMPRIWGLSKTEANYRAAPGPEVRCDACRFMFPKLVVGGCRYVRGAISASCTCDEFAPA